MSGTVYFLQTIVVDADTLLRREVSKDGSVHLSCSLALRFFWRLLSTSSLFGIGTGGGDGGSGGADASAVHFVRHSQCDRSQTFSLVSSTFRYSEASANQDQLIALRRF